MINTGNIYNSLQEAITLLNSSQVEPGERIIIPYRSGDHVDVLIAIGTKKGIGPDTYSVISGISTQLVRFVTSLPDVSTLVNSELLIWTDPESGKNYKVYLDGSDRVVKEVSGDLFVSDKATGSRYYVTADRIRKFSDFCTSEDLKAYGKPVKFMTRSEYNESTKEGIIFICERVSE